MGNILLTTKDMAEILNLSPQEIARKARLGQMLMSGGSKYGLIFDEHSLMDYVANESTDSDMHARKISNELIKEFRLERV